MSDDSDDFEQELLQAVGRGGRGSGSKSRKWSKNRASSSEVDISGDSDDDASGGGKASGRQRDSSPHDGRQGLSERYKSSHMPLKKRYEAMHEDDETGGGRSGGASARGVKRHAGYSGDESDGDGRKGKWPDRGDDAGGAGGYGSDDGSELSFGSDLYKDDEDRERLQVCEGYYEPGKRPFWRNTLASCFSTMTGRLCGLSGVR